MAFKEKVEAFKWKCRDACSKLLNKEKDRNSYILQDLQEYSSGEDESEFDVPFVFLTQQERKIRSEFLWLRAFLKARGAAKILEKFGEVHRNILIFGTTKNIDLDLQKQEREAYKNKKPWIILPDSTVKKYWNFIIMFLLMYTASFVPVKTAFFDDDPPGLFEFELLIDVLFTTDLFVNFVSAYVDQTTGFIEVRQKKIAQNYLTSWFALDITACIPFQLFQSADTGSTTGSNKNNVKLLRLARLPRLYRLLRILRLFKMVSVFKNNNGLKKYVDMLKLNQGMMRMVKITAGVFFMVHLMSCFWFLSAKFNDFEHDCWVVMRGIEDRDDGYQYLTSIYWALQTITTVGYGDIPAATMTEQILSVLWMIFGVGFYSFTIGNLSSVIASMDTKNGILKQKLNTLQDYAKRIALPIQLEQRIKRFLENNNKDVTSLEDQERLLLELPPSLKSEVVAHTHGNIIQGIKFFSDKNPDFLWQILPLLKPMKIYKGDILFSQGDLADEIYFILKGNIVMHIDLNDSQLNQKLQHHKGGEADHQHETIDAYNVPFNLYVEGSYFGDSDCLYQRKCVRECMAEADQECHLLQIKKNSLEELLEGFNEIKNQMINISCEKRKYHKRLINELVRKHRTNSQKEIINELPESPRVPQSPSKRNNQDINIQTYKSLKRRKSIKPKNPNQEEELESPSSQIRRMQSFGSSPCRRDNNDKNGEKIAIITYSEGMKDVIKQFRDNSASKVNNQSSPRKINFNNHLNNDDFQLNANKQISKKQTGKESYDDEMLKLERERQKLQILNDSESYYEKNLVAFNNNMSLLALNTYEISQLMGNLNRDNQQILSIAHNIQVHNQFIQKKSDDLKKKMMLVVEKFNKYS